MTELKSQTYVLNVKQGLKGRVARNLRTQAVRLRNRIRLEIAAHAKERTGALEDSWQIERIGSEAAYRVFTRSPYAQQRDKGGTIRAKNAQYLTIPLVKTMRGKTPRQVPGGRFVKSKKGNLLYGLVHNKQFTALFALKKSVAQTGWHYVDKARDRWLEKVTLLKEE